MDAEATAGPTDAIQNLEVFTLPGLLHSTIDKFLKQLSEYPPCPCSCLPVRYGFRCYLSHEVVSLVLRRIPTLIPDDLVLLESGTFFSGHGNTTEFRVILRHATDAEKILTELLPITRKRLAKHFISQTDVQQRAWSLRHVAELTWDKFTFSDAETENTSVVVEGSTISESTPGVQIDGIAETELLTRLARYHISLRFHNTMSRDFELRGYEDYYPRLPHLAEDVLERVRAVPDAVAVLEDDGEAGKELSKVFSMGPLERQRAYSFKPALLDAGKESPCNSGRPDERLGEAKDGEMTGTIVIT